MVQPMRVEAPSYRSFMETSLGYGGYGYTHKPSPRSSRCQGSFQHLQELSVHRSGRFLRGRRVYGESLEDLQVGNVRPSFCLRKPSSATDAPPCLVGVDLGHALSLPTEKPQLARTLQSRPGATSSTPLAGGLSSVSALRGSERLLRRRGASPRTDALAGARCLRSRRQLATRSAVMHCEDEMAKQPSKALQNTYCTVSCSHHHKSWPGMLRSKKEILPRIPSFSFAGSCDIVPTSLPAHGANSTETSLLSGAQDAAALQPGVTTPFGEQLVICVGVDRECWRFLAARISEARGIRVGWPSQFSLLY